MSGDQVPGADYGYWANLTDAIWFNPQSSSKGLYFDYFTEDETRTQRK